MLSFNTKGLLTPDTNLIASVSDLKKYFVEAIPSTTRPEIFEKYIRYSNALKKMLKTDSLKQWINGSFVTMVRDPKDIDLITFIDLDLRVKFQKELMDFSAKGANEIYGVDAYLLTVLPDGHEKIFLFHSDKAYWMSRFSKTRRDNSGKKHPKGFLEINY
jgi:hypothetical protein